MPVDATDCKIKPGLFTAEGGLIIQRKAVVARLCKQTYRPTITSSLKK